MSSYGQSWYSVNGFKDTVTSWCPSDSEDRFEQNMADPAKKALLEQYGWTRDNISYTFNKDGFRSEEFTYEPNDSVLFLGCSLTTGIGVDLESSWAYRVASSLGLRRYNLGVGASSADTCFRLAHHWIPRLRPKYVMMFTPMVGRMEIVLDKHIIQCMPSMNYLTDSVMVKISDFYNGWLSYPANTEMNRLKNVMGVQTICNSIGVPLVEITVEDMYFPGTIIGNGRDLKHPGREWHARVAEKFLSRV